MELTDWIGQAVRDSGLTGKALEERTEKLGLKITQPTISRIISGRHDPAFSKVAVLAKALGLGEILPGKQRESQRLSLSGAEETILAGFSLMDEDAQADWLAAAQRRIENLSRPANAPPPTGTRSNAA